jgi:hypothetical protein
MGRSHRGPQPTTSASRDDGGLAKLGEVAREYGTSGRASQSSSLVTPLCGSTTRILPLGIRSTTRGSLAYTLQTVPERRSLIHQAPAGIWVNPAGICSSRWARLAGVAGRMAKCMTKGLGSVGMGGSSGMNSTGRSVSALR